MNHIFIYGHAHFEGRDKDAEPYNHAFATTATLEDGEIQLVKGLNFGSHHGFDRDGEMGDQKVSQALILPISDDAFNRFNHLIDDLGRLDSRYRSPFYFSRYGAASVYLERPGMDLIDLEGKPRDESTMEFRADGFIDAFGHQTYPEVDMDNYPVHNDIQYVHANCVEMTNFVTKRAGIDVAQVNRDWWNMAFGRDLERTLATSFNNGQFKLGINNPMMFGVCISPDKHESWKVMPVTRKNTELGTLIATVAESQGGAEKMFDFMQTRKPFDCEPAEIPEYLQHLLDELPHAKPHGPDAGFQVPDSLG